METRTVHDANGIKSFGIARATHIADLRKLVREDFSNTMANCKKTLAAASTAFLTGYSITLAKGANDKILLASLTMALVGFTAVLTQATIESIRRGRVHKKELENNR